MILKFRLIDLSIYKSTATNNNNYQIDLSCGTIYSIREKQRVTMLVYNLRDERYQMDIRLYKPNLYITATKTIL